MRMITKEQLEALRSRYPAGTRVELLQMDDVQAPPIGTKGTVPIRQATSRRTRKNLQKK